MLSELARSSSFRACITNSICLLLWGTSCDWNRSTSECIGVCASRAAPWDTCELEPIEPTHCHIRRLFIFWFEAGFEWVKLPSFMWVPLTLFGLGLVMVLTILWLQDEHPPRLRCLWRISFSTTLLRGHCDPDVRIGAGSRV